MIEKDQEMTEKREFQAPILNTLRGVKKNKNIVRREAKKKQLNFYIEKYNILHEISLNGLKNRLGIIKKRSVNLKM